MDCASDEEVRLALGATPLLLHKALQARQLPALTQAYELVQSGTTELTLETVDHTGISALHQAVVQGYREGVEFLLARRADPCSQDNMRRAPLHPAVLLGNHRVVQLLLEARADAGAADADPDADPRFSSKSFEERPDEHRTPLHYAAELGSVLSMRFLLQQGSANPNAVDSKGQTPLHLCLGLRASADAAEQELEVGSGVRVARLQSRPEWNGRLGSVFGPQASQADGKARRWPVLLEGDDVTTEGILLKADNLETLADETLDLLLEARADVNLGNHVTGESFTVLHEAARTGDATLVTKVLAANAGLDRQDAKLGFSALHLAARAKHHEVVKLLLEARADTSATTATGKTAAELAETNGAGAATVALLRGEAAKPCDEPMPAADPQPKAQTIHDLTPEQRAMFFID